MEPEKKRRPFLTAEQIKHRAYMGQVIDSRNHAAADRLGEEFEIMHSQQQQQILHWERMAARRSRVKAILARQVIPTFGDLDMPLITVQEPSSESAQDSEHFHLAA